MSWFKGKAKHIVTESAPVMTLIGTQVQGVRERVESAVVETCQLFQSMARNTNEMIQLTVGGSTKSRSNEIICDTRDEIREMLESLRGGSDIAAEISLQMEELQNNLVQVNSSLMQVERVSSRARIVALNGQLEAINAGSSGNAFAEVANQARDLATNVDQLSQEIRDNLGGFSDLLESVAVRTSDYSQESRERLEKRTESANNLMNELEENQRLLETNLEQATGLGQQVSQDIGRAVSLLQFQDEVSQRLEHVIHAADQVHELMTEDCPADEISSAPLQSSILASIEASYTMDSERGRHHGEAVSEAIQDDCQVELF